MRLALIMLAVVATSACESTPAPFTSLSAEPLTEALLSVGGRSASDVWAVGADKGAGPIVLHYDGGAWSRVTTGSRGTLWWVHAFEDGTVFAAGASASILRWDGKTWSRMPTPGVASSTVFGVWGRSPSDAYAVGSVSGRDGFIWHWDGSTWSPLPVPFDLPSGNDEAPGFFKVCGNANDVWVVGAHGTVLRSVNGAAFVAVPTDTTATLFTVSVAGSHVIAVGGSAHGTLLELGDDDRFHDVTPEAAGLIQGVAVAARGRAIASGEGGSLFERGEGGWQRLHTEVAVESLHAAWVDESGGVWAVGGGVLSPSLDKGQLIHRGTVIGAYVPPVAPAPKEAVCPDAQIDPTPQKSIARRWNEQILGAIRRDLPRPGVHARNLFHLSAAMWDAWATYDTSADGVFFNERHVATDREDARREALSYAAYRVLVHRYQKQTGGAVSAACFTAFMAKLGYDPTDEVVVGDAPRAVGNRIASAITAATIDDGANEASNYADTTGWKTTNPPLVVEQPGTTLLDPDHWQPLNLAVAETQNGIVTMAGVQGYIGASWDLVRPFALHRDDATQPYHDAGPAPKFAQPEMKSWVLDIIRREAELDPTDATTVNLSPGVLGNNPLGTNDGTGRALNPVSGLPYASAEVRRADFGRVLAEFWADGPSSETPPGHWNLIANSVADNPQFERRLGGVGGVLDALEWDVKIYLALNGAVHDAAIVAWGTKRRTTTARPISLVRHMAALGQASDPALPYYDPNGLPLVPGLIELITVESSASGQRHAHLRRHLGEIAVRAWRGEPGDRQHELGGVAWIRAREWVPYQRRTFVTPAFPGFTSGHSTFSRAAAEVLSTLTGSPYFPGGLGEYVADAGSLTFETGPTQPVRLQWATYYDAADQAGQSRLWGGIHLSPDDLEGRRTGSVTGIAAVTLAMRYFDGSAIP